MTPNRKSFEWFVSSWKLRAFIAMLLLCQLTLPARALAAVGQTDLAYDGTAVYGTGDEIRFLNCAYCNVADGNYVRFPTIAGPVS